ncbi:MAG: calcium-binding protein, partial [Hyphomicrobiales bacterium]
ANYAGIRAGYTVGTTAVSGFVTSFGSVLDTDTATLDEGSDTLNSIEKLVFSDVTLDLTKPVQLFSGGVLIGTFDNIQDAQNAAASDDKILVGTNYTLTGEDVHITKALTIISVGTSKAQVGSFTVDEVAVQTADGVTVRNFNVVADGSDSVGILLNGTYTANGGTAGTLVVDGTNVSGFAQNGIFVGGGGSNLDVTISNAKFTGNGTAGGAGSGDVKFYEFTGDLALTNVAVTGTSATTDHGIAISGYKDGTQVIDGPIGAVTFTNVTVDGSYEKTLTYIVGYNDLSGLTFTAVDGLKLGTAPGGATVGWTALFVDGGKQAGNAAPDANNSAVLSLVGVALGTITALTLAGLLFTKPVLVIGLPTDETITGSAFDDLIISNAGNDTVDAGAGNDVVFFSAGEGNDTLIGGGGTDALAVFGSTAGNTVAFTDMTHLSVDGGTATYSGFEAVVIDAKQAPAPGVTPTDTAAADTLDFSALSAAVQVNLSNQAAQSIASSGLSGASYSAVDFENVTGGSGNDTLAGSTEDNVIIGGAGNDAMSGGDGDDTFVIADAAHHGTGETILGGGDVDTIRFTQAGGLLLLAGTATASNAANNRITGVERIELVNDSSVNASSQNDGFIIIGSAQANTITGSSGADTISAGDGADIINYALGQGADIVDGGGDADTLNVSGSNGGNAVTVTTTTVDGLASVSNVETLNVALNGGGDTLTMAGLLAGATAINLDGGTGTDTLDLAALSTAGAGVTTTLGTSLNAVTGANIPGSVALLQQNFENATGGAGADRLTGSAAGNVLNGAAGDDILEGRGGVDTVRGGADNDTIRITNLADYERGSTILGFPLNNGDLMDGGSGDDTLELDVAGVLALGHSDSDTVDIETISLLNGSGVDASTQSEGFTINGSSLANSIIGSQGNDIILAGGGDDTVNGGGGDDMITGGAGNDVILGGLGNDTAVYAGLWSDYRITFDPIGGTFTIVDTNPTGGDGTDLVTVIGDQKVEFFVFNGVTYSASQLVNAAPAINLAATQNNATIAGPIDERAPGATDPAGSFGFDVVVTDPNNTPTGPGDVLRYSLSNDAGGRFTIDAGTGRVTVANWALFD